MQARQRGRAAGIADGRRDGLFREVERRHPRGDDRDDFALIGDDGALRHDGRAERGLECERRAGDERQRDPVPVFTRQVLDDAPGLEIGLAVGRDDDPVRRTPHRCLGEVADREVVFLAVEVQQHLAHRVRIRLFRLFGRLRSTRRGLGSVRRTRRGLFGLGLRRVLDLERERGRAHRAAAALDHRERRQEIADHSLPHLERGAFVVDVALALEVPHAVAIDDHAPQREIPRNVGTARARNQAKTRQQAHLLHQPSLPICRTKPGSR